MAKNILKVRWRWRLQRCTVPPAYAESCPAVIIGVLQLWKRRFTKWCTLSTASSKLSISGTRRASSLPYFSLGTTFCSTLCTACYLYSQQSHLYICIELCIQLLTSTVPTAVLTARPQYLCFQEYRNQNIFITYTTPFWIFKRKKVWYFQNKSLSFQC